MLKWVFYFLQGYVIIKVEGKFPERFLNVAGRKGISLRHIHYGGDSLTVCIRKKDFPKMSEIAKNTDCRVKVLQKRGLPYSVSRNRHRKALFIGIFVFFVILFSMLSLLWKIEIKGISRITEKQILEQLEKNGIYPYAFVYGIDKTDACNRITAAMDDIAWMGIEIRGSCAFVEIVETVEKPEIQDKSMPCNLVSDKDGVVTGLEIESGITVVKIGDTISKGQLLVSGIADSPALGVRFLHAEGEVYVKTWHERDVKIPLTVYIPEKTGKQKSHFTVELFGKTLPVWFNTDVEFQTAEQTLEYYGPVKRTVYKELIYTPQTLTEEQALKQAKDALNSELSALGEVVAIHHKKEVRNNILHIHFTAEVIEKTGVKRMIERETDGENFTG